jgi:CRISPR-associated protein Cas1
MQVYLDSYGAFLNVKNGQFQITPKYNDPHRFAPDDVDVIFLTEGVTATADALMLALKHDIPVVLLNYLGQPVGQVWSGRFGSIATIRRHQVFFATTTEGWQWMGEVLAQKIDNQQKVLRDLVLHLTSTKFETLSKLEAAATPKLNLGRTCATLDGLSKNLRRYVFTDSDFKRVAMDYRAYEATASRHYFRFIAAVMPHEKWRFTSREYRPARDYFNCLLNYLYGMLYAQVELALIKVGIDPALGILHVDRYNRPPMVYDFIEPYRYWAETVALDIALADTLSADDFHVTDDVEAGIWLGAKSKGVVIQQFLDFLNETIDFKKKKQKRLVVLDLAAQQLATQLKHFKI